MKTLQENSTHYAVENKIDNTIEIWTKGLEIDDLVIKPHYCYSIPKCDKDDLFSIFETLDENNRINLAELNASVTHN